MEFVFLLENSIDKIQNLKEYYETQIKNIETLESEKEDINMVYCLKNSFLIKVWIRKQIDG